MISGFLNNKDIRDTRVLGKSMSNESTYFSDFYEERDIEEFLSRIQRVMHHDICSFPVSPVGKKPSVDNYSLRSSFLFNLNSTDIQNESVCFNNVKNSNNTRGAFRQNGIVTQEFKIDMIPLKDN